MDVFTVTTVIYYGEKKASDRVCSIYCNIYTSMHRHIIIILSDIKYV